MSTRRTAVTPEGIRFRDLNGNGVMAPYEDPRLPGRGAGRRPPPPALGRGEGRAALPHDHRRGRARGPRHPGRAFGPHSTRETGGRAADQPLQRAPPAHRARDGPLAERDAGAGRADPARHPDHLLQRPPARVHREHRHGLRRGPDVPVARAARPGRHRRPGLVQEFADIVRREYRAVGLCAPPCTRRSTSPPSRGGRGRRRRSGRTPATASAFVVAYLRGLQGDELGPDSVAVHHQALPRRRAAGRRRGPALPLRPGAGLPGRPVRRAPRAVPRRDRRRDQRDDAVLRHARRAASWTASRSRRSAFSFNRRIITGLLREELGFDGVVLTDWGLVTDVEVFGKPFPAKRVGRRAPVPPRARRAASSTPAPTSWAVRRGRTWCSSCSASGRLTEERLDESVRRLLLVKFQLGLFDDPYVDEDDAERVVGTAEFRAAGHRAQARGGDRAPQRRRSCRCRRPPALRRGGRRRASRREYGTVVSDPAEADVAVVRLQAPFEPRDDYFLEAMIHQGSLDFPAEVVERITKLAARCRSCSTCPSTGRRCSPRSTAWCRRWWPASAPPTPRCSTPSPAGSPPRGRLPFELPRSMDAVRASRPDVPSDTADPLYPYGSGQQIPEAPQP